MDGWMCFIMAGMKNKWQDIIVHIGWSNLQQDIKTEALFYCLRAEKRRKSLQIWNLMLTLCGGGWSLCKVNGWAYSPLPSSSLHGVLHLYQEVPTALQPMVDKPSRLDLVWTRLLFIPSLPVPTPPPRPLFSWQALIWLPNRLQTRGFAVPHRAAHRMWASFQNANWVVFFSFGGHSGHRCFVRFLCVLGRGEQTRAILKNLKSQQNLQSYSSRRPTAAFEGVQHQTHPSSLILWGSHKPLCLSF